MDVSVSAVTNTYAYDSLGRPIAHTDGRGNTRHTEYNALDQRSASIDALGNRTSYAYDQFGNLTAVTNPLGNAIVYEYDLRGRKTYEGGATYPVRYTYDVFGNKATMMTYRNESLGPDSGDVTTWLYDEASGCMTNKVYADGKGPTYGYTPDGRLSRRTWARGIETDYAYDGWGNLTNTVYSDDTPPLAYSYADSGKLASAILSDGTFYAYGYDAWLLNTNESVHVDSSDFGIERSHDEFRRALETAVVVTNVRNAVKVRLYDSENRMCGYAFTNAAGRGVSVSLGYDGSYLTNMTYVLPNGGVFTTWLMREEISVNLVTRRDYFFGGQSIYWYSTEYDLLNRPTNATDSVSLVREWLYNRRSELAAATVGTDRYGYAYDSIGNRLWSAANAVTNSYTANSLNQYTAVSAGANPVYDADGNMTGDGTFAYAYDAENRLVSVTSAAETNGAIRVLNAYDHRNRRIRKTVQLLHSSIAPPPSPPVGIHEWETQETHTFVWDGNNIVLEKVEFANGTTRTFEYFWGADKSGTEQGAGGVEGLLAVSVDGVFYIPCYDHNGNIILYVSETGSIAAQYTYDPYGNIVDSSGNLADVFSFGFSTQYHDRETGMVGYKRRFYRPDLGRWLNRDPIEEEGGENVYCFVENSPSWLVDLGGLHTFQFTDKGWSYGDTLSGALTDNVSVLGATRTSRTSSSKCSCTSGKWSPDYTFKVEVYSLIQFADDSTWDDDNYGSGVRDPRVREKWDSFWFFEARRRRNLVIEHEERHRKHAQKNYNAIVRELNVSEQYSSKGVCESKASEKIAAAVRLFDLMERADEEKVERGDL